MTMHPPKGYVVLWMAKFRDNDCKSLNAQEKFGSFDPPRVAYSGCLTHIERFDWEMMCSMEALVIAMWMIGRGFSSTTF
jgi:hypothetical protein